MTSPTSSSEFITIYDRADFKRQDSASVTLRYMPRIPVFLASLMSFFSVSVKKTGISAETSADVSAGASAVGAAAEGAGAASFAGAADAFAPSPRSIELNFATKSDTSIRSSGSPLATLLIICSNESIHLNSVSIMSPVTASCSLRNMSSTSSIS